MKRFPVSLHIHPEKFLPATDEEKSYCVKMRPSETFFRDGMKRLLKNKVATACLVIIILITLMSVFIPMFWPYGYEDPLGISEKYQLPDPTFINLAPFEYSETELVKIAEGEWVMPHIFGTDDNGYDYFIRVVYGARISLAVGFFASIIVLLVGIIVGSISGYFGGKTDLIIMRIVDIIYSLPDMLMVILLAAVLSATVEPIIEGTVLETLGTNILSLFVVFALLYWVSMARLIRGQILTLKEQEYVLASEAAGAKGLWIIRKHLLPNSISVIIISSALQIPNAIFTESYLSFLGLGVNAPMPSLGSLASNALSSIDSYPYLLIIPAAVISLIVLSLNLLGDGLRDAFDPKLKN